MNKLTIILVGISIMLISFMAAEVFFKIEIEEGKNKIILDSDIGYASDLIKLYPEIETISYKDGNKTIGFVNAFGGIGNDFMLESNKTYEVNSNKNITIYIKWKPKI